MMVRKMYGIGGCGGIHNWRHLIPALSKIMLVMNDHLHVKKDAQILRLEIFGELAQKLPFISQIEKFR